MGVGRVLDTVRIESPPLAGWQARALERLTTRRRQEVYRASPDGRQWDWRVLTEFCAGQLVGSWDSKVAVRVERSRYESRSGEARDVERPASEGLGIDGEIGRWDERTGEVETVVRKGHVQRGPIRVPCMPYAVIEASVHKVIAGFNIFGGPEDVTPACRFLIDAVAAAAEIELPEWEEWVVKRADWAECFDLRTHAGVKDYVGGLIAAHYPRRKPQIYGEDTIMWVGEDTSLKFYAKGPEYQKHDLARVRRAVGHNAAADLAGIADGLLRVEVTIRGKTLARFEDAVYEGELARVGEVEAPFLQSVYDREVGKVLREGQDGMVTVRRHKSVEDRLNEVYGKAKASLLFGLWMRLSALGEREAMRTASSRATFYRQRKELVAAGCAWNNSDVRVLARLLVPEDFAPLRNDARRVSGEHEWVREALAPYRGELQVAA